MKNKEIVDEEQERLEEYKKILSANPACAKAAAASIARHPAIEDQEYLMVWAPALIEFTSWLIEKAKEQGIRRLYFLARDAYPMYLAASMLIKASQSIDEQQPAIDCRYLKVSRYALRIPEYHLRGKECLDQVFFMGIDVTLRKIFRRAALTENEIDQVCQEMNCRDKLDTVLNRKEIYELREEFKTRSKLIYKYIYEHSKVKYDNCLGYLRQEGMLDETPWAVVDSGWIGTIEKSIRNILAVQKKDIHVHGYYFGLYELPPDTEGCTYEAYYFNPKGSTIKKMNFSNCLYEVVYTQAKPMVKAYTKNTQGGISYEPVYSDIENPNSVQIERNTGLLKEFIEAYIEQRKKLYTQKVVKQNTQKALQRNTQEAAQRNTQKAAQRNTQEAAHEFQYVAEKLYTLLMANPTRWEARYYGNFLFSDDICDEHNQSTANQLTEQEVKDLGAISKLLIAAGISKKKIHESAWIEGTIVNLNKSVRANMRRAKRAKYLTHLRQSIKAVKR